MVKGKTRGEQTQPADPVPFRCPLLFSALRVLRGGRPSAQHQHPSGDHKGAPDEPLKRPQASGEAGPKENKPRLGNERLWEGQVRPSLAEAKKAADAAAEAAAKEIMTKETESKVSCAPPEAFGCRL